MELISKAAVVAEIESLKRTSFTNFDEGVNAAVQTLLEKLDTVEVKELDLKKELSYEDYAGFFKEHPNFPDDWGFDEAWIFAKYFFELGRANKADISIEKSIDV